MFKIAVCDDEEIVIVEIQRIITEFMQEHNLSFKVTTYHAGEELLATREYYDVVFLDISMHEMNGIETGTQLYRRFRKVRIIYITSFREYCMDAMNHVHAFAYLSKPISKEKLEQQLMELVATLGEEKGTEIEIELDNVNVISDKSMKNYPALRIAVSKILYFEYVKSKRRIHVHTLHQTLEYIATMQEVEQKMKMYGFGVCYRGVMVNLAHVMKASTEEVYLNNGERLPLSKKRAAVFKSQLNDYIHGSI